jgi:hypothetical protein
MSVKVTMENLDTVTVMKYPRIMRLKGSNSLVYFVREGYGLPIVDFSNSWNITEATANNWIMDLFEDYNGPITLQND